MNITINYPMKNTKTFLLVIFFSLISLNSFAGNGSGNPKNDSYNLIKPNPTPVMIWKDGHLVKNPEYFKSDSPYMKK
ncbi:hypothetical protein AO073_01760 [Pseudomonas syringae ICMP 11293]|nr:hypothetical protein AO073_01760 [Pseudomonas syringae ICMP 11293]